MEHGRISSDRERDSDGEKCKVNPLVETQTIPAQGLVAAPETEKETGGDDASQSVKWQFEGKAFRDRPFELIVVSRIAVGGAPEKNDDQRN